MKDPMDLSFPSGLHSAYVKPPLDLFGSVLVDPKFLSTNWAREVPGHRSFLFWSCRGLALVVRDMADGRRGFKLRREFDEHATKMPSFLDTCPIVTCSSKPCISEGCCLFVLCKAAPALGLIVLGW